MKWTNPLVTVDKLNQYLTGPDDEVIFETSSNYSNASGTKISRSESITRGFLRNLLKKINSDDKAIALCREGEFQQNQFELGLRPQPEPSVDKFFDFMNRLQELEPKLASSEFASSIPEIALIAKTLIKFLDEKQG